MQAPPVHQHDCGISWSNLPAAPPLLSDLTVQVWYANRHVLDRTWRAQHRDDPFDRIYLVESGTAAIDAGSGWHTLRAGRIYLIPAGTAHRHACPQQVDLHWCHCSARDGIGRDLFAGHAGVHERDGSGLVTMFTALAAAVDVGDQPTAVLRRNGLALVLLSAFADLLRNRAPGEESADHALFRPVLATIENELMHHLSTPALAARVGLGIDAFTRRFRRAFGVPPYRYVLERRLALAKRHLASGDLSLEEISDRCGFCDAFALSRAFSRHFGLSPSAYRAGICRAGP